MDVFAGGSEHSLCVCPPEFFSFVCHSVQHAKNVPCRMSARSNYARGGTCYAEQEQMIPAVLIALIKHVSLYNFFPVLFCWSEFVFLLPSSISFLLSLSLLLLAFSSCHFFLFYLLYKSSTFLLFLGSVSK